MASSGDDRKFPNGFIKKEKFEPGMVNPDNTGELSISRIITTLETMDRTLDSLSRRIKVLEEQRHTIVGSPLPSMLSSGTTVRTLATGSLPPIYGSLSQSVLMASSTAEHQRGIQLAVSRLDRWSGDLQEVSWTQYRENFERVCAILSEPTRLMVLDRVLDSPAKSIFLYLLYHNRLDWEHLNIEFMREFDGESRREAQMMTIFSTMWDADYETLHQFSKRISNLVDQAFPPQDRDHIKIQQVIRAACNYPIFQGRSEWIRELSWSSFLDVVKEWEKIFRSRQQAMMINSLKNEHS